MGCPEVVLLPTRMQFALETLIESDNSKINFHFNSFEHDMCAKVEKCWLLLPFGHILCNNSSAFKLLTCWLMWPFGHYTATNYLHLTCWLVHLLTIVASWWLSCNNSSALEWCWNLTSRFSWKRLMWFALQRESTCDPAISLTLINIKSH